MSQQQGAILNKFYRAKKIQLQSTKYLQNICLPTHDRCSSEDRNSQYSNQSQSQSSFCFVQQDLDECVIVQTPYAYQKLHLISSLAKPTQLVPLNGIEQKKRNYNELLKKKEENRQKFIQKINKNLNQQNPFSYSSNSSVQILSQQPSKRSIKIKKSSQKKIQRSQTQQIKSNPIQNANDTESNWDKKSQIDFNLTSQRQNSDEKKYKSAKKKITIKKKQSLISNGKDIQQQKHNTLHKNQSINKSVNEFLFIEQYQKDQKEIMNRLLTIIQQDHINRVGGASLKQSLLGDTESDMFKMSKIKERSLNNSTRFQCNPIDTQYSSVKPIVINNYIRSPTQYLDKGLLEKQMAIKTLEQNRKAKYTAYNIMANSRKVSQSRFINSVSKDQKRAKKQLKYEGPKQESSVEKQENEDSRWGKKNIYKIKSSIQDKLSQIQDNDKDEDLDFEQLYQKMKQKSQKNVKITAHSARQKMEKNQDKIQQINLTQGPSHFALPINSSRQQQGSDTLNSNLKSEFQILTSHNMSLNVAEFNPNRSAQFQHVYDFKKPSVSMEISFGNQNKPQSSLSLADAFKKKFGQKKTPSKGKNPSKQQKLSSQPVQALSQLKIPQNINNIPNVKIPDNLLISNLGQTNPSSTKKNLKLTNKRTHTNQRQKQNFNSLQTPRNQSQLYDSIQRSKCTNISKQPSKQLLDRLIYGQKVSMTKKQMFQLTKKNYKKLPEIEQKRKQEQKRINQLQRLSKIKDYQKRIRSKKNSICKDSIKNFIDQNVEQRL